MLPGDGRVVGAGTVVGGALGSTSTRIVPAEVISGGCDAQAVVNTTRATNPTTSRPAPVTRSDAVGTDASWLGLVGGLSQPAEQVILHGRCIDQGENPDEALAADH